MQLFYGRIIPTQISSIRVIGPFLSAHIIRWQFIKDPETCWRWCALRKSTWHIEVLANIQQYSRQFDTNIWANIKWCRFSQSVAARGKQAMARSWCKDTNEEESSWNCCDFWDRFITANSLAWWFVNHFNLRVSIFTIRLTSLMEDLKRHSMGKGLPDWQPWHCGGGSILIAVWFDGLTELLLAGDLIWFE